jgi:glycolate oxidase iron-sulfur subunit
MSAARVLDQLGISVIRIPQAKCCGALEYHLEHQRDAIQTMKMTIDAWWPWIEKDVEAIVTTASGCGLMLHEYKQVFADDPQYRQKAAVIAGKIMDVSEVLLREDLTRLDVKPPATKIAFHPPCTLQHGLGLAEVVESILGKLGFNLARVKEKYLCCGSAGSYSLLQPKIANALRARKLSHLNADSPSIIATANIGCSSHLSAESKVPVVHWIELLDTTRNIDR